MKRLYMYIFHFIINSKYIHLMTNLIITYVIIFNKVNSTNQTNAYL